MDYLGAVLSAISLSFAKTLIISAKSTGAMLSAGDIHRNIILYWEFYLMSWP